MTLTISEKPILMSGEMVRALLRAEDPKKQTRRIVKLPRSVGREYRFKGAWVDGGTNSPFDAGEYLHIPFRLLVDGKDGWAQETSDREFCPYGSPGDQLWVKETFQPVQLASEVTKWRYAATDKKGLNRWIPSIFCNRAASRINLEIQAIRVERLQDISEADALAEGIEMVRDIDGVKFYKDYTGQSDYCNEIGSYQSLWNSLNLKPKAIYGRDNANNKIITDYVSYPWSDDCFDRTYPGARKLALHKGKPLTVISNPWVWVIEFKKVNPQISRMSADSRPKNQRKSV